jgi:tetratricopeptide (TPR) repeat protein
MRGKNFLFILVALLLSGACGNKDQQAVKTSGGIPAETVQTSDQDPVDPKAEAVSLLGQSLYAPEEIPGILIEKHKEAFENWNIDKESVLNWIWYGRHLAYTGQYRKSIEIFTQAIEKFPNDPRLYRHRGHRYITIRKFQKAISDFNQSAALFEGQKDKIEPDGLPNSMNTPLSTLQGNVWYHLGLAHYLENNMELAFDAYSKSLAASGNDDMKVACIYWLYMIKMRMGDEQEAVEILQPVNAGMEIIENMVYHQLCLFFKKEISKEALAEGGKDLAGYMNDAIGYGLGNSSFWQGNHAEAERQWKYVLDHSDWDSFASIAAEADYCRLQR